MILIAYWRQQLEWDYFEVIEILVVYVPANLYKVSTLAK